jgi:hypothetical protein
MTTASFAESFSLEREPDPEDNYRFFVHPEGKFSFEYRNNLEVKQYSNIYYVQGLLSESVVFQIWSKDEVSDMMYFSSDLYSCLRDICMTKTPLDNLVKNIETGKNIEVNLEEKYERYSRAQLVKDILDLRFPYINFDRHRDDCFTDIKKEDPLSGYACFAKKKGYINGVFGEFQATQTAHLWAVLKLTFLAYDIEDFSVNEDFFEDFLFAKLSQFNYSYSLMSKAYFEGFFENIHNKSLWNNRAIFKQEARQIMRNVKSWTEGKKLKDYDRIVRNSVDSFVFLKDRYLEFDFKETDSKKLKNLRNIYWYQHNGKIRIFTQEKGKVYRYLTTLDGFNFTTVKEVQVEWDSQYLEGDIKVILNNEEVKYFNTDIDDKDFLLLQTQKHEPIKNPHLSPNKIQPLKHIDIPQIEILMRNQDFHLIIENRTGNERYPALVLIKYPDGNVDKKAVLIKTRGNASRGFIKSSYTIEAFDDFKENPTYSGDEFLQGADEFKLKSMITDTSLLREKVLYHAFRELGYPEPDYMEVMVNLNGQELGFYQLTEAVQREFFERRFMNVKNYYYSRNIASEFHANLTNPGVEGVIEEFYRAKGDEDLLFHFIDALERNDQNLLKTIDLQNIFDYSIVTYFMNAHDSILHNYYLYFDENDQKWRLFFWDGDSPFGNMRALHIGGFKEFVAIDEDIYNKLIDFAFDNINDQEFDMHLNNFIRRWFNNVDLEAFHSQNIEKFSKYMNYDNQLWNNRYLERPDTRFNSVQEAYDVLEKIKSMNQALKQYWRN